ncbi:MAG: restriction endonuclease [Chloroflexi bacterium]|nr:MAG: restriction endonuclease [Chloroflexota bacterium]
MARCTRCGTQTSWLRRVKFANLEFCSTECSDSWKSAHQTETLAAKDPYREARQAAARKAVATRRRRKVAEQQREQAERQQRKRILVPHVQAARDNSGDPYAHLDLAKTAMKIRAFEEAREAYLNAIALGIPNPRESGLAKWNYADLLWKTSRPPNFPIRGYEGRRWEKRAIGGESTSDLPTLRRLATSFELTRLRKRDLEEMVPNIVHYVREAEVDLQRHLRSQPDDVEVLEALVGITRILRRRSSSAEEQLRRVRARRVLQPGASIGITTKDRSGLSFESKCLKIMHDMGLRAELTRTTADGGIDIVAFNEQPIMRGKYIIQCKDWTNPVGEPVLRDLLGVVHAEDAVKGVLITSGTFTAAARRFAEGKRLELIDGREFGALMPNTAKKGQGP